MMLFWTNIPLVVKNWQLVEHGLDNDDQVLAFNCLSLLLCHNCYKMKVYASKNNFFILVHILCWLILAAGVLYNHPDDWTGTMLQNFRIKQTVLLITLVGVFYLNYYLLIPKLLIQRKVYIYILVAIALVTTVTYLNTFISIAFNLNPVFPHRHPDFPGRSDHHDRIETFVAGINLLMIGLGITISFIQKWQQEVQLRQQLEQEKVVAELTMLKAQINPHFFFNTLNNIYAYTLSDGDVARTAITNLSKMMRYVLYDSANGQTPLSKEIAFIREYTELMKLRVSKKTTVLLQVQEPVNEVMIAPMLFLPFVENAFKHGVSSLAEGHISIWIMQDNERIKLIVKNTVYEKARASEDASNGIGIINTTRRLELLYPGKYTLTTGQNGSEYEVKLNLFV